MDNWLESLVPQRLLDPKAPTRRRPFILYCRVSTPGQVEAGNSLEAQERECREYAQQMSCAVLDVYMDEGVSAYADNTDRPGLWAAMRAAITARADVLVREYSRFSRDADKATVMMAQLREKDVNVVSATEHFDLTTPEGRAILNMKHHTNEMESVATGLRTLSTMRQNFRTRDPETGWCYKNGGPAPYGYRPLRLERGTLLSGRCKYRYVYLLDDRVHQGKEVWEWLRHALVELRLKQGASYSDIADFFNAIDLPRPRPTSIYWNISTVQEMCRWDRLIEYTGVGLFNRTAQKKSTRRRIGRREKPRDQIECVQNAHPAILTVEEAQALEQLTRSRQARRGYTNRVVRSAYLLTGGLSICTECGEGIVGHGSPAGRRYVCGMYKRTRGTGCTSNRSIRCELVDERLIEYLYERYASPQAAAQLRKAVEAEYRKASGAGSGRKRELKRALLGVEGQISRLVDALACGGGQLRSVTARIEELETKQDQIKQELESEKEKAAPKPPDVEALMSQFKERFREAAPDARKRMVKAFIRQVEFDLAANEIRVHQYQRPELEALAQDTESQNWIQVGSPTWSNLRTFEIVLTCPELLVSSPRGRAQK